MTVRDLTILGCSSQQPTRLRNHGAYLVRWNNEGLLFDPGEGTQRQFIFANISPTTVNRIFISHFHGDHCLGLGSMLMRLNLDRVCHPIHCYYPASGKKYFDRLRYSTIYHEHIHVVEHPISQAGVVEEGNFRIEAIFLDHGVETIGWRITEPDRIRFDKKKLQHFAVKGRDVKLLQTNGSVISENRRVFLEEVSAVVAGDAIAVVVDTRPTPEIVSLARGAKLFLCESTYLEKHRELAAKNHHLTAREAASLAKESKVEKLILTHFSARYLDLAPFIEEAKTIFENVDVADDFKIFPFPRRGDV